MKADWLDEVSLSYAKNFAEIEAARAHFDEQRVAVMTALAEFAKAEVARAGLTPTGKSPFKPDAGGPWWNIHLQGEYALARSEFGDGSDAAGVGCGFASGNFWLDGDDVELGIHPYLSFTANKQDAKAIIAGTSADAFYSGSAGFRVGGGGLYILGPSVGPSSERFSFSGACEILKALIDAYSEADRRMAHRYREIRLTRDA